MKNFLNTLGKKMTESSPGILAGIGIVGMFTAIGMAIHATPKAIKVLDQEAAEYRTGMSRHDLTIVDTVKIAGKYYIPTIATAVLSSALIIEGYSISRRRHAALAAAYGLSEAALKDFQDKLIEVDGEKKLEKVKKAIAKGKIEDNPVENREVFITEKGVTLCYEPISGRYFKSDIDKIKKTVNDVNARMLSDGCLSLNDFYYELGLGCTSIGDDLGWSVSRDSLIELDFTSTLASDGTPCLVLDYRNHPKYGFDRY